MEPRHFNRLRFGKCSRLIIFLVSMDVDRKYCSPQLMINSHTLRLAEKWSTMDFPLTLTHDASLIEQIATPQTARAHRVFKMWVEQCNGGLDVLPRKSYSPHSSAVGLILISVV